MTADQPLSPKSRADLERIAAMLEERGADLSEGARRRLEEIKSELAENQQREADQ